MIRRQGASLMNVMVFMMFAVMITAQAFFFAKSSVDSVSEERELLMYRLNLDSLVEEAKKALINDGIVHYSALDDIGGALKFSQFYDGAKAKIDGNRNWELSTKLNWADAYEDMYNLTIHDLDYSFDASGFDRNKWTTDGYGTFNMNKKPFSPMLPRGVVSTDLVSADDGSGDVVVVRRDGTGKPVISPVYNRFFVIRAWVTLPENYHGMRLMYQVFVSRDEPPSKVETLSFQEVWF